MALFFVFALFVAQAADYAMGSVWVLGTLLAAAALLGFSLRAAALPSIVPWAFAFAVSAACIMANARFGLNLLDEGFTIGTLSGMLEGGILYSDTSSMLTPGLFFAAFPFAKVFGLSVWTLRWFMGLTMALVCAGSGCIVHRMTGHPLAAAMTWLAVLTLSAGLWFAFFTYGWLAVAFGLLALFSIYGYFTDRKPFWAALAGVSVALSGLTKQTLGVYFFAAALASAAFGYWSNKNKTLTGVAGSSAALGTPKPLRVFLMPFFAGLLGTAVAFAAYLAVTGSAGAFVEQSVVLPLTSFGAATALPPALPDVPRSFDWATETDAYAFIFYAHIAIAAAGAAALIRSAVKKRPDARLGLLLFFALAALMQNFERASINKGRTSFVFALLLLGYLIWLALKAPRRWAAAGAAAALLLCAAAGSARLDAALFKTYGVPWEKVAPVRVSAHDANRLPAIVRALENAAGQGEKVFVYPASSLLYHLAGVENPVRYKNIIVGSVNEAVEREVIEALESKKVRFALYDEINIDGLVFSAYAPDIDAYIRKSFRVVRRFGENTVLLERKSP